MIVSQWDGDDEAWDALVARSVNGTFLHTRRYLGYHGDRFTDVSVIVRDAKGRLVGVMPAALDPGDETCVVTHPGITYGGLVHDGSVQGASLLDALHAAITHWRDHGCSRLRYKAVPFIYHRVPAQDDLYALFRLGARLVRQDLSATIDLSGEVVPRRNRRRNILERADELGLSFTTGRENLPLFWPILTENLRERFGVTPVHSLDEITSLASHFPDEIECQVVLLHGDPVAGAVLYNTDRVVHPQYQASSARGREVQALELGITAGIAAARERGARFYDFGISTEQDGRWLNSPLFSFKTSFGGGGVTYDHYELDLA